MSVPDETTPHILIVDDDTRIRELLKKYLSDNGYRTSAAADATQAQEKMGALTYDLLVLDVMMPGINGLEFTERLRKAQEEEATARRRAGGDITTAGQRQGRARGQRWRRDRQLR